MSFAALARSTRAANDTTRVQINNIPKKVILLTLISIYKAKIKKKKKKKKKKINYIQISNKFYVFLMNTSRSQLNLRYITEQV